jgi:hypothetical protein
MDCWDCKDIAKAENKVKERQHKKEDRMKDQMCDKEEREYVFENYEEPDFFEFDPNRLDEEWLKQPRLFYEHATYLAKCRKEYEQAKAQREVVEGELARNIRKNPESYGLEKTTDDIVKKTIPIQQEMQEAETNVIETQYAMNMAQAAVDALSHRKTALENDTSLRIYMWNAEPKAKGATRDQANEMVLKNIRKKGQKERNEK